MKQIKKLAALLLALAMVFALAACSNQDAGGSGTPSQGAGESKTPETQNPDDGDSTGEPTQGGAEFTTVEAGKLIMSTNAEFPPYEMLADGDGAYKGFEGIDVEIAVLLAERLNLELVIDDMDFDSALIAVQQGKSDMVLAGLTYREDRDEVMDFSTSYAKGVQVVIVPDGSDITDLDALEGKIIGTQRGTTGYIYASDTPENGGYGEDHVRAYDNGALAVQDLLNGRVDAVIIDNGPAKAYVEANEGLHILDTEWVMEDYCLAVSEGNTALLNALNAELEAMIADGTVQTIIDKYITE